MGIKTILTIQLDHIHLTLPSNEISLKSSKRSRKRRQIFIPDKPPFVNYASAYINPYRSLSPIPKNHYHRFQSIKRKKSSIEKCQIIDDSSINSQINLIDLWPSNPNSFDMDFIRQRQIAIDNNFYREKIDEWKPTSFEHLIILIRELIIDQNLIDCVWIIFYWICQNISYDNNKTEKKLDEIFYSRKTNSEGYAYIFHKLCQKFAIQSVEIIGYVKDRNFHFNQTKFLNTNHHWNAVQLDNNQWYLIDCTYGSGYLTTKQIYKHYLQTFYFLTRPEQFIYEHLPNDSQWQCLSKPISMLDYIHLPLINSFYFIYNLTIISPRFSNLIHFDSYQSLAEVLIQAPNDIQITCTSKDDNESTCLCQYDVHRRIWQCFLAPYQSGFYTLVIFANRLSKFSSIFLNVMEFGLDIPSEDFHHKIILPKIFAEFSEYKCQIFSPMNGRLKRGKKILIHCRIPQAYYGRLSIDGICLDNILIKNGIFKQEIIVPQHEIIVYGQFFSKKSSNIYTALIRYLVEE